MQGRVGKGALEVFVLGVIEHVALFGDAALLQEFEKALVRARSRDAHVDGGDENGLARHDRHLELALVLERHGDGGLVVAERAKREPDRLFNVHARGGVSA